jgi:RecA-family ATPase
MTNNTITTPRPAEEINADSPFRKVDFVPLEKSHPQQLPPPPNNETPTSDTADALARACTTALLTSSELSMLEVPLRPHLLGEWMREGDLGFIFAPRGVGKTWETMLIANALSEGTRLGEWAAGASQRRVLYVDGEMNLRDTKERNAAIGITSPNFLWLHHERLFQTARLTLNLGRLHTQRAISALLSPGDVLILDNLSALCRGVAENDNDQWEAILPWLLGLRNNRITTIIVHHAGRNGQMRGASRREDAAHWILSTCSEQA